MTKKYCKRREMAMAVIAVALMAAAAATLSVSLFNSADADDGAQTLAAPGDYNAGDIAIINDMIAKNGLAWTPAPADGSSVPSDWIGVYWSSGPMNKRIIEVSFHSQGMTGTLDISGLTDLKYFECSYNQLTVLNIYGLTGLEYLCCDNNCLTELNVSGLTGLEHLCCGNNCLTELNVSGLTKLKNLYCCDNCLTELNVSGLTGLEYIYCYNNCLTELNVSGLTELEYLCCDNNRLTALDLTGLTKLITLGCSYNLLTDLDLTDLTSVRIIYCNDNLLTTLDLTGLTALEDLFASHNKMTSIDVAGMGLKHLDLSYNFLTSLDVSGVTAMYYFDCSYNRLTSLDLAGLTILSYADCRGNLMSAVSDITGTETIKPFKAWDKDNFFFSMQGYTVTYDPNGGTGTAPIEWNKSDGDEFTVASADGMIAPAGKRFKEWNIASDGSGISYTPGDTITMSSSDIVLYAIWDDIPGSSGTSGKGISSFAVVTAAAIAEILLILILWRFKKEE